MLRQPVFGWLAGYENVNDVLNGCAMIPRCAGSIHLAGRGRATMSRLATDASAVRVQSVLRSGTLRASSWQRPQRRWLARRSPAYRGALSGKVSRIYFRADAGFANPEVYEYLEAEGIKYAIRLPANRVLQERIGYPLKRPVGNPCPAFPCQLHLSGGKLDEATSGRRQG
jgi:hypothetical protein